jgi:hypothetical protein
MFVVETLKSIFKKIRIILKIPSFKKILVLNTYNYTTFNLGLRRELPIVTGYYCING